LSGSGACASVVPLDDPLQVTAVGGRSAAPGETQELGFQEQSGVNLRKARSPRKPC
jgi:hypothetical protein